MSRLAAQPLPFDQRRTWGLMTGAGDAPVVQHAVGAVLILSAASTVTWLMAWFQDAWLGRASASAAVFATLVALAVLVPCWRLWQRWHAASSVLTLHWEGLPKSGSHAGQPLSPFPADAELSGWWVSPWRCAADLTVVLDLQRHVLIKLMPRVSLPQVQPVWLWVDLRAVERRHQLYSRQASAHMLRVCMHLRLPLPNPQASPGSIAQGRGIASAPAAVMASSSRASLLPPSSGPDLAHKDHPTLAALLAQHVHADFADTEVFVPEVHARVAVRAEAHRELA